MPIDNLRASEWLDAVNEAERRGELLSACDLADRGLGEHPDDVDLRYRSVRALARAGSTTEAARRFLAFDLGSIDTEDARALWARIQKDVALAARPPDRRRLAALAAASYREVFEKTGGFYPAINAATLSLVADEADASRSWAQTALDAVAASGDRSYFALATEAEAHLLLRDVETARSFVDAAAAVHGGDYAALATSHRQLRMVCALLGIEAKILESLVGPTVAHFCGHRIVGSDGSGRIRPEAATAISREMTELLVRRPVSYAYGSLSNGADIMWAESLIALGAEVYVVLPCAVDEFVERSVATAGEDWVKRFHACLGAAAGVTLVTPDAYLDSDVLYRHCAEVAMGLTLLRGRYLDSEPVQLAVWDGSPAGGAAGTAIDIETWRRTSHESIVVGPAGGADEAPLGHSNRGEPLGLSTANNRGPEASPAAIQPARIVRAMVFADTRGFSRLSDEQIPAFAALMLDTIGEVVTRHRASIDYSNTWGDALFLVMPDVEDAAVCALDLQEAVAGLDLPSAGLPADLALRLAGNVGPAWPVMDPVLGRRSFMGSQVNLAARLEPVTPPGAVYVTEGFAAILELSSSDSLRCDYVGHLPTAKEYGRVRMYRLRRANVEIEGSRVVSVPSQIAGA